ncbi:MAG: cysteine desulfurase NifS [Candidatus Diapherotrites archaeon]
MKKIYLDNAATTKVDKQVISAMAPYFDKNFGNASSLHSEGRKVKQALEKARKTIARKLNADPEEIIFTSGGTESNNLALKGIAFANKEKGKHIITTQIEHDCVLNSCKWLEKQGFEVTYLPVDEKGFVKIDELKKSLRKDTILVSVIHANNEIGTIEPIEEISRICNENKVYFHTDACQSFTKVPLDVKKQKLDLVTINSHKIYGPKGVGALYIKKGTKIDALHHGGGHEKKLRSGTENIAGIVGFAKASETTMKRDVEKMEKLREILIKKILEIPDTKLNGDRKNRLANNVHFSFDYIEGESLVLMLDAKGIMGSTGSACSTNSLKPSHVLIAIGLKPEVSHGSLRLTLGKDNNEKEIEYAIKSIKETVEKLREMSPMGGLKNVQ